jgi:hypothetical protein
MAGVTRLELATSCVTGKRSNQLSYTPLKKFFVRKNLWEENYKLKNKFSIIFLRLLLKNNSKFLNQDLT